MGGNIFKNEGCERKSTEDFLQIRFDVMLAIDDNIEARGGILDVFTPKACLDKESHGDVDIIIACEQNFDIEKFINETFNPPRIAENHNVYSFPFKGMQIDLIRAAKENFDIYCNYIANGDSSMTLGRLSRYVFDCAYGIHGLEYIVRGKNDAEIGRVNISKEPEKIISFLGYDFEKWENGFRTENEMFEFLASSPYFGWNEMINDGHFGNCKHRKREHQRPQYNRFVTWAKENRSRAIIQAPKTEISRIMSIEAFFGVKLYDEVLKIRRRAEIKKQVSEKWSGVNIMELTGLKGKELGAVIESWKDTKGEGYDDFVLNTNKEDIQKDFETWFAARK